MKLRLLCCILVLTLLSLSVPFTDQALAAQSGSATVKSFFDSASKDGSGTKSPTETPEAKATPPKNDVKTDNKAEAITPPPSTVAETTATAPGSAVIQRAKEELALLAPTAQVVAGKITASPENRSIVYEDVSVTMPEEMPDFVFRINKVIVDGMDAASYQGTPGDATQIEKLSLQGIKLLAGETPMAELDEYFVEGLSVPYRDLLKALLENKNTPEASQNSPSKLLPILSNSTARLAQANKFKMDIGVAQASIDQIESKDFSLASSGPMAIHKILVSSEGKQIFSLDKFGHEGVVLPELFKQISQAQNQDEANQKIFAIMGDPIGSLNKLAIKGFHLNKLQADIPGYMPITLSQFISDLLIENNTVTFTNKIQDLALALSKLEDTEDLAMLHEASGAKDILLNMDFSANYNAQKIATIKASLSEKEKGNLTLEATYAQVEDSSGAIHTAEFKAINNGIIDLLLSVTAILSSEEGSYKELLPTIVEQIQATKEEITEPGLAEGVDKAAQFVQNGGTFRFTLRPKEPIDLDDIDTILEENPAALGYEIEYTPLATPIAR